jgi:hypothetical protein
MDNTYFFIKVDWNMVKKRNRLLNNKKRLDKEELKMKSLQEKYLKSRGLK